MRLALAFLGVVLTGACATKPAVCGIGAFRHASHMTNPVDHVFVVRQLKGRFLAAEGEENPDSPGAWRQLVQCEVHGPGGIKFLVPIADDGTFLVQGLPAGTYCFHTWSDLMQGYEGTIVISRKADPAAIVEIRVAMGV